MGEIKIAVYAISRNEDRHVKQFMDSIDACGFPVYVLDHSTDKTADLLRERGAVVDHTPITPFRWDVGKNAAMNLVPEDFDVCINMDLDETISHEARKVIESVVKNKGQFAILRHLYRPEETDRVTWNHRIHHRKAAIWASPVHEYIESLWKGPIIEIEKCLIEHHPPKDKKHSVADKIISALKDDPKNERLRLLCARDLYFENRYAEAIEHLKIIITSRVFNIQNWRTAQSLIAKCWKKQGDFSQELKHLEFAVNMRSKGYPRREAWVELSHAYMLRQMWVNCKGCAKKALKTKIGRYEAENDPGAWSFKPYELLMHAKYNLGSIEEAIRDGEKALNECSIGYDADRIRANLEVIREVKHELNQRRVLDR